MLERRISAPPNLNKWQLSLQESSEPVLRDEPHLTETTRRFSQMGVELPQRSQQELRGHTEQDRKEGEEKVEEQEEVMLWRPKRGSLKLPRLDVDSSSYRTSSGQKATG
ncbi:hypothetical protein Anas_07280 [Armadillidium nasatum]|uniref:Uncharacterized protein n=1 Tax=Armadillidium nasatum TaxID=96803 RepID=A0A5N5SQ79_9CRUS|nr:hypothetical protein Anas_07280 [Armadillidium nasatum]